MPRPRLPSATRALVAVIALGLSAVPSCRTSRSAPPHGTDFREITPVDVAPAFSNLWKTMVAERERDPAGPGALAAAEAMLRADPPAELRAFAILAKAEHAYLNDDDATAITSADAGLRILTQIEFRSAAQDPLQLVRARALVRSGEPTLALEAVKSAAVATLDPAQRLGLSAVAFDRAGQTMPAIVTYIRWRTLLADGDPSAAYAEDRLATLFTLADPEALRRAARQSSDPNVRGCLLRRLGQAVESGPNWSSACVGANRSIGILLPRSGRLSALADVQLDAAVVALEVLNPGRGMAVVWQDSGSTSASAVAGANKLIAQGVDVVVGPVGSQNVQAVTSAVGDRLTVVVPGEPHPKAIGSGPSLERRAAALAEHGTASGRTKIAVAYPETAYGRRALHAIQVKLEQVGHKSLIKQSYDPSTTSFSVVLDGLRPALGKDGALIVVDHVGRLELIVRQLARRATEGGGPLVLSTAEGLQPTVVSDKHKVLEGVVIAPAAAVTEAAVEFAAAYERRTAEAPGDQALLVFYALRRALHGGQGEPDPTLLRISGGQLVAATR